MITYIALSILAALILFAMRGFIIRVSSLFWPIFWIIPHPHLWRKLTSELDYGNGFSRHWGNYGGTEQKECVLCGKVVEDKEAQEAKWAKRHAD